MKNHHSIRSYLLGVLTTLMIFSLAAPALAAANKMIEVSGGVRIFIDDVELRPTDANGNPVDVFVYNGTTYLPVRAISEGFGKPVQWDGSTRSVYIGKHSSNYPVAYLNEMDYFTRNNRWITDQVIKDNLGNEHTHAIRLDSYSGYYGDITYKLNGQYSRLTAVYYQVYESRAADSGATLIISGDGRELWRGSVAPGVDPINIDIDLTGVLELKLEHPKGAGNGYRSALGDVALWS